MFVRLYGKGAISVVGGPQVARQGDGWIEVPVEMKNRFLQLGFSESPPVEVEAPAPAAQAPEMVAWHEAREAFVNERVAKAVQKNPGATDEELGAVRETASAKFAEKNPAPAVPAAGREV
jgi:hypothetical protein